MEKHISWEPAREARRRPGCRFELRRAKRAGAETGIWIPEARFRPRPNKKIPAPESGPGMFKKMFLLSPPPNHAPLTLTVPIQLVTALTA